MHAIVCHEHGPPEVMRYEERPRPEPGPNEVLVKTDAVGVNYVDTMRRSGNHPTAPKAPFVPGIEACGEVVAIGAEVDDFQPGDRVIARSISRGAYAEYACFERRFTVKCPPEMPADQAAALFVNGQTAYHALVTVGKLQPDENVLITAAAGGVGLCAVQIAKALGACVVAAAGTDEKLRLAAELGADVPVNYRNADWPATVNDATGDRGADLVLESVGTPIFEQCKQCWAPGGRVVIFGKAGGAPATLDGDELLFGNRAAYGLAVGMVIEDEPLLRASMQQLFDWCRDGTLKLIVGETHPLREAPLAHRRLVDRKTHGKIVLVP